MAFCPNCGSPAEGRFCEKCGAALEGGAVPGPARTPAGGSGLGMEENAVAALCYLPFVGVLFLLIDPYNKNRTIRFHAFQSIFYYIAWIIIVVALGIVGSIIFPVGLGFFWFMVSRLVEFVLFVGLVIMAVKAFQRQRFLMPIVGPLAEKQAGV
jgi:uncharacterized membrane protein